MVREEVTPPRGERKRARRRWWCALVAAAAALVALALPLSARTNPVIVWFTPGPGTLDMLRLFEAPSEWPRARARMSVFKFYQGQLQEPAPAIYGPNTYDALRAVDAFRILSQVWHKRIAIEVGAVKEYYCTGDASGMKRAVRDTLAAMAAVRAAGGEVSYLALDEPFASGLLPACGGPQLGPTLNRLQEYFAGVHEAVPAVAIGLIEPYPTFSARQILEIVSVMGIRGILPAFFHLDADLNQFPKGTDTYAQDLPMLQRGLEERRVPFGVIFWGLNGDSDALYARDVLRLVRRTNEALLDLPRDAIFQSWAVSRTGARITPTNLPEWGSNTHTALIDEALQLLRRP